MGSKFGKNEKKRAEAAAFKELDDELTDEQRAAMLKKGMGIDTGGLQKGEEKLFGVEQAPPCPLSAVCEYAAARRVTHARTHVRTYARTHVRTHARTHARAHA
jgi:hypothetical protein